MEVTRKQSAPNFRKNEHFLPNHIHTCVLISLHYLHIIRKSFLWLCSYFLDKIHCYAYSFIHPFKHSQLWSNATDLRLKDKSLFPSSHSTLALPGWPIILCVSLEDSFFLRLTFSIFQANTVNFWGYDYMTVVVSLLLFLLFPTFQRKNMPYIMRLVLHLKIPDHYRTQRNKFNNMKKLQIWKINNVICVRTLSVTL